MAIATLYVPKPDRLGRYEVTLAFLLSCVTMVSPYRFRIEDEISTEGKEVATLKSDAVCEDACIVEVNSSAFGLILNIFAVRTFEAIHNITSSDHSLFELDDRYPVVLGPTSFPATDTFDDDLLALGDRNASGIAYYGGIRLVDVSCWTREKRNVVAATDDHLDIFSDKFANHALEFIGKVDAAGYEMSKYGILMITPFVSRRKIRRFSFYEDSNLDPPTRALINTVFALNAFSSDETGRYEFAFMDAKHVLEVIDDREV